MEQQSCSNNLRLQHRIHVDLLPQLLPQQLHQLLLRLGHLNASGVRQVEQVEGQSPRGHQTHQQEVEGVIQDHDVGHGGAQQPVRKADKWDGMFDFNIKM